MSNSTVGLLASFDYVDSAVNAIGELRAAGLKKITAYMPYPEALIEEALGYDQSPVRVWALAGGLLGAAGGLALTSFTSMDWPLVTGGKPILSIPAYVIITFEMMVLFGALSTVIGFFINSRLPYVKPMVVYDPEFSGGKFGIYVTVAADRLDRARGILKGQDPAEIREDPVGVAHAPSGVDPESEVPGDLVGVAHASVGVAHARSASDSRKREARRMLVVNLKIFAVVIGTIGTFTFIANRIPQLQSEVPIVLDFDLNVTPEELTESGEALFNGAGACVTCHGLGERAPNLLTDHEGTGTIGVRCADRVPGEDCKAYFYSSLVDPTAYLVEGFAPIMTDMRRSLSNPQIWALVAYLESLGGEVTVTGADIAETDDGSSATAGAPAAATASRDPLEIMRANACFACHLFNGEGVAGIGPTFDRIGARVAADYIRESILDPVAGASEGFEHLTDPPMMPATFGDQLSAGQLEALVQFLVSQR